MKRERYRRTVIISLVGVALFISNLDASIVNIAMPTFVKVFNAGAEEVSRIILMYLLAMGSLLLIFGRLGDLWGSERVFTWGFLVFSVGSLLCGLSWGLGALVFSRLIQGVGGAMIFSTFGAIIIRQLPVSIRGRVFGLAAVLAGIGFAAGSPLGGFILKFLNWRWLFMISVPVGVAGFLVSSRILTHRPPAPGKDKRFDLWGAGFSIIGLVALIYLLSTGGKRGWLSPLSLILMAVFLLSFFFFIRREKRFSAPLMDLTLFQNRDLARALLAILAVMMAMNGLIFLFPFYLEMARGFSTVQAGLFLIVAPAVITLTSPLAGYLSDISSPRRIATGATLLLIAICGLFLGFGISSGSVFIIGSFAIFGFALAMFLTSNVTLIMSHAPEEKEGIISAVNSLCNVMGLMLGVALFALLFANNIAPGTEKDAGLVVTGFREGAVLAAILFALALAASYWARESVRSG